MAGSLLALANVTKGEQTRGQVYDSKLLSSFVSCIMLYSRQFYNFVAA